MEKSHLDIPCIFLKISYDRCTPGISKSYDIDGHIGGIYQVYTTNSNFLGIPDAPVKLLGVKDLPFGLELIAPVL